MKKIYQLSIILALILFHLSEASAIRPFRVAVVIGDQWKDPASYMIEKAKPTGEYSGYFTYPEVSGTNEFQQLTILLKSWGIPFDIIRLDQQFLNRYMFLDMYGQPKYGTIIWNVNESEKLLHPDYNIIKSIVQEYEVGLIALSDRIMQAEIQELLGLNFIGAWESNTTLKPVADHFLTKGLSPVFSEYGAPSTRDEFYGFHMRRQQIEAKSGTEVIVKQGEYAQATYRVIPEGGHVVWIGGDSRFMFNFQDIRTLLKRSITWTVGYSISKTWENDIIMIMDDPGGAQNAYLEHWHYPTLTEEQIVEHLIKPLQENNAILNINFVPAFENDEKESFEPAWNQNFTDELGSKQNYISGKKGYDKGVELGVFEVMCHGLTHMQPDLKSEPTFYGSDIDKEKAEVGWYREFGDTRRLQEIPAAEQLWRMKTAKQWLIDQFGVVPLEFCAGGNGTSISYYNNTCKLAALAGFGWCGWAQGYCGKDMVIIGWEFLGSKDSPAFISAPPNAHDFGIAVNPEEFPKVFENNPDGRFISINEYIGYIHASNSGNWFEKEKKITLNINYDPHYCRYFDSKISSWDLEVADWLVKKGKTSKITINGKSLSLTDSAMKIAIPEGTGEHNIEISF